MVKRAVFFLSDQTGVTAEALGHSLITQFPGQSFREMTVPFIDSEDKAREAVRTIDAASKNDALKPLVFSTLVQPDLRTIVRDADGLHLDIFDAFLEPLSSELKQQPTVTLGGAHGMSDIDAYMKRIEATNFALANDDGGVSRDYDVADVILVGVSRSGKTPTCLYLALQYGVYAANYPLTDEELETGTLPDFLIEQKQKLFGLTIAPLRLQQIRKERRPMGNYSSAQQVRFELREAAKMFRRYGIPHVDTTEFSIEEISSRILDSTGVERRVRP
ncbi:MAG: kinase/pyrophosphorylase [Gammaproteobacteria bacterium]|nr:kinase/pyrophosphorylase [Gammaproteobacteria bacterium]MBU2678215.1 kinase/pyrophosphorylase [Gammaproteobacteria bacterium]NNC56324.1 kinase/pyrophosphorylase [Woeseiaceae bacterium]NNL51950.1 kinase/pyrophosphorylase [Woeseiaceae bacterium]